MARKKRYQYVDMENDFEEYERPSRSQKKRDSTALQKIGEELVELPLNKVKFLPITPELQEALELMARISDREGRRRQMQYIGKLMRENSADELRIALDNLKQGHNEDTAKFHHAEKLREALLDADNKEQDSILLQLPENSRDELRELVQKAIKENSTTSKRVLFRKLRSVLE